MAGYATGEVFFVSQLPGFRHSHLDAGGYRYDQKYRERGVDGAIDFLVRDEQDPVFLAYRLSIILEYLFKGKRDHASVRTNPLPLPPRGGYGLALSRRADRPFWGDPHRLVSGEAIERSEPVEGEEEGSVSLFLRGLPGSSFR